MTAVLQQVFSILMNISLQRKFQNVFLLLKCSVCSVQVQRLVCVQFVLHVLLQVIRTSSKWAVLTTAGQISLLGACVFRELLTFSHTVFLCSYSSTLRNSSRMILNHLRESLSLINSAAAQLLYSLSQSVLNQQLVLLIKTSLRVFRHSAVSMALFLYAMKL